MLGAAVPLIAAALAGAAHDLLRLRTSGTLDIAGAGEYHTPYPILPNGTERSTLSHTRREKLKLLNRVRRVRGQIEAVERALEEEKGCANVLHLIVAARG